MMPPASRDCLAPRSLRAPEMKDSRPHSTYGETESASQEGKPNTPPTLLVCCLGSRTDYSNQLMPELGAVDEKPLLKVLSTMIKSEGGISSTGGAAAATGED